MARSAVKDTDEWPSKYSKLFVELDDGLEFSFTDKRRFAKVRLLQNPVSVPPISELGPDALLEPMTIDEFINSLSKKKIKIKALLLDQSFISGIGNWVADEVLYQARIHPEEVAASLSKESCAALHKSIKEVIEKAVDVGADSSQYPSNWIFHSREKKPGQAFVDGKKIEFIVAGARTTAYVPELQKLSGSEAAKAPTKLRKQNVKVSKYGDGGDDFNAPGSEEEANRASVKAKVGRNSSKIGQKKTVKRKSSASDSDGDGDKGSNDDNEDNHNADQKKKTKTTKNPPAKRKAKKESS
ncbi:DNA-(apurinic or apyrimidinic site) lyase [Bertholletia excelsa]